MTAPTPDPTPTTPPEPTEAAMNVNLTFDDITVLHEALIEWAIQILAPGEARTRLNRFADFVVRHPELFTAITVMKGTQR